ncbi:MAG: hemerythrin domain-containing protein [Thermoplasmata archaeon]
MASLVEILTLEHLSISRTDVIRGSYDYDSFVAFRSYLKECHIEIEEKICFPILEAFPFPDAKTFSGNVERIKADHKLIDTLAGNIIKWSGDGKTEMLETRLPLFYKLLTEHNTKEEDDLFPRWGLIDSQILKSSSREAMSIIDSFGRKEYMKIIGFNDSSLSYFFGIK